MELKTRSNYIFRDGIRIATGSGRTTESVTTVSGEDLIIKQNEFYRSTNVKYVLCSANAKPGFSKPFNLPPG